jgi:hypothetical protein
LKELFIQSNKMKILDKEIIVNNVGILTATDMVVSINYDDLKSKAEIGRAHV